MQLHSGAPFWLVHDGLEPEAPPLSRDERCDVAVVGAGISGALVADALTAAGLDVVVLEQRAPGTGSTAASTSLLQYEVDVELTDLIPRVGEATAVRAYRLGVEAIDRIGCLASELGESCGYARRPSLYLASRRRHAARLQRECETRSAHGLHVEWWDAARVASTYGFRSHGALWSADGAEVDGLCLTRGLLGRTVGRGGRVYPRTTALGWDAADSEIVVSTDRQCLVRARHLVLATGYEVPPGVDRDLVKLHSTYAIVTEPLAVPPPWHGQCLVWESSRPYFYMRGTADGRIIAGGEDVPFRDPGARDLLLPRKTRRLARRLNEMLGDAPFEVALAWAGTFAETRDGLPYIGPTQPSPNVLVALGYGGNGITFSVMAAEILRDLCIGRPNDDAARFRIDR